MLKLSGRRGLRWKMLPLVHFGFRTFGLGWTRFYAWMLNRQDRGMTGRTVLAKSPAFSGNEHSLYDLSVAGLHLDLLKKHGLQPHHFVLDFGCGHGRSAVALVPYLDAKHYIGTDLSRERIRIAIEIMNELDLLQAKEPVFVISQPNNSLAFLGATKFDFVWARAVLAHMPFEDVRVCLTEIYKVLNPGGVFIGDYIVSTDYEKGSLKDFRWPQNDMIRMAQEVGFKYSADPDANVGISDDRKQQATYEMLVLRKI